MRAHCSGVSPLFWAPEAMVVVICCLLFARLHVSGCLAAKDQTIRSWSQLSPGVAGTDACTAMTLSALAPALLWRAAPANSGFAISGSDATRA